MCGGHGTRMWPASRTERPKQFLRLIGEWSTFQQTVSRVHDDELFEDPICMTNEQYRFIVAEQLREIGRKARIVIEPARRDSAPAVCAGCLVALEAAPDAIVLCVPADHHIADREAFLASIKTALAAVSSGHVVTFGVKPSSPETAYGYIEPSKSEFGKTSTFKVKKFVEKPNQHLAEEYVRKGYLWNAGMFLADANAFLDEIDRFVPELKRTVETAACSAATDLDFLRLDADAFERAESISIDYAVIEKSDRVLVLPIDYEWSDIGSWTALWNLSEKDDRGNAVQGDVYVFDGHNNYVRSNGTMTCLIGVDGLVVIATGDVVTVIPHDKLHQLNSVVDELRKDGRPELDSHREQYRPWGHYVTVDRGDRYQVKRIMVEPEGRLSLQKHFHRSEHWVVVRGTALVSIDGKQSVLSENESVYIPLGSQHRLENPGKVTLELIEVQSGSYLDEDDIVRYDDAYNRLES